MEKMTKNKAEPLDFGQIDFMVVESRPERECKDHPKAPELLVDDDQIGKCTSYCLGCIYKQLKEKASHD